MPSFLWHVWYAEVRRLEFSDIDLDTHTDELWTSEVYGLESFFCIQNYRICISYGT